MDDNDPISNTSHNQHFADIVEARFGRRGFLGGGLASAVMASAVGTGVSSLLSAFPVSAAEGTAGGAGGALLGFAGIPVSTADAVVVAPGYTAKVLIAWGDPVSAGPLFQQNAGNSADDQGQQWGMHNDGVVYFPLQGSARGLLVQNHEYTDDGLLFTDGIAGWNEAKTSKSLNAHGVSVIEITKQRGGRWRVVRPSPYARRITGQTPIEIAGPAAGDERLMTTEDPTGRLVLGTLNNCAMGHTPWGTYLACEENFNGYFQRTTSPDNRTSLEKRYGVAPYGTPGAKYWTTHPRFNADVEPNEPNRFGWVVEFNPYDPNAMPAKRTALGRIKHEGARVQEARDGRVVVYTGDDERNEYIYRFVSADKWRTMVRRGEHPLDHGTLFVAKFDADGTGRWLELTPNNPALAGWSLADILINTRGAADAAGATMMDRPEWIDTFSNELTAIAALTNNSRRGTSPPSVNNADGTTIAGAARPPVDAANPRTNNVYGHIIRWGYQNDWTEPTFWWDIFALAGDPSVPATGSTVNGDTYGSPDGIYVAPSGRLWIQTDVSTSTINTGSYAGYGNNQMLCADPATKETRRFLVGPRQCEITGAFVTPDERTMFVGIQHPGEPASELSNPAAPKAESSWPDGETGGRPRSACLVITKDDGGPIGS